MELYGWKSSIACWKYFKKNFLYQCSLLQLVRSVKLFWGGYFRISFRVFTWTVLLRINKMKDSKLQMWLKSWMRLWPERKCCIKFCFFYLLLSCLISWSKTWKRVPIKVFWRCFIFWQFYTWHLFHFFSISIIYRQCLILNSRGVHLYQWTSVHVNMIHCL